MGVLPEFSTQGLANLAWAFASVARGEPELFMPLGAEVAKRLSTLNSQELANTAWAFTVSDVRCNTLFGSGSGFVQVCAGHVWNDKQLCQLHQWSLWRDEVAGQHLVHPGLPPRGARALTGALAARADASAGEVVWDWPQLSPALRERAERAFLSAGLCPSRMQKSVQHALESLGLRVAEEVRIPQGYSIDLAVEWGGVLVGVEVDGPSHFIGNAKPTGSTVLKRRQLSAFGWQVVSVPYFDWERVRTGFEDRFEQRQAECAYLAALLDEATGLRTHASGDGWVAIDCRSLLDEDRGADLPSYVDDGEADPADPCHAPPDAGVSQAEPPAGATHAPPPDVHPAL